MSLWLSKVGLLYQKWVCGYLEGVCCPESWSVAIKSGSVVQKVGLWLSKVGLLSMEWVCGELEWICRPENKSVAF